MSGKILGSVVQQPSEHPYAQEPECDLALYRWNPNRIPGIAHDTSAAASLKTRGAETIRRFAVAVELNRLDTSKHNQYTTHLSGIRKIGDGTQKIRFTERLRFRFVDHKSRPFLK